MQKILFKKVIVFIVINLLIDYCTVTCIGIDCEVQKDNSYTNDLIDYNKEILRNDNNVFALIGNSSNCSMYKFELSDLNNLTLICEDISGWGSIAWITSDTIIYSDNYGNVYEIDLTTCECTFLGDTGSGPIFSLAYDPSNAILYGISTSNLYKIDIETGNSTLIGSFGIGNLMISCDCDINGNLYGIDMGFGTVSLYSIDTSTGIATVLGIIGMGLTSPYYIAFDKDFHVLYLCQKIISGGYYISPILGSGYNGTIQTDEDIADLTISFNLYFNPPITNISFDPPEPNGCNNWYISNVTVTLNATDNSSVNATYYKINGGEWLTYNSPFILSEDGEYILIEFYSVDDEGNHEQVKSELIDIDKAEPLLDLYWEAYEEEGIWWIIFTAEANDETSGMNRVEFYLNDVLKSTIEGAGPMYYWEVPIILMNYSVNGIICNKRITDENISFFALVVWTKKDYSFCPWEEEIKAIAYDYAGNFFEYAMPPCWPPPNSPIILRHFTFKNNYTGYVGRFFINAKFENGPLVKTLLTH